MNIHFPTPGLANRSTLWLLIAVMTIASLFPALHAASQPVLQNSVLPAAISVSRVVPQALPVPEPPRNQPALAPLVRATPVPPGIQLRPTPQPVPTPPSGQ